MPDSGPSSFTHVEPSTIEHLGATKICSIEDCDRSVCAKGLCSSCYQRERKRIRARGAAPFLPYPNLADDDPRFAIKSLVNLLSRMLADYKDNFSADVQRHFAEKVEMYRDLAEAPNGYYPISFVKHLDPLMKLTEAEIRMCLRTLPPQIADKLFGFRRGIDLPVRNVPPPNYRPDAETQMGGGDVKNTQIGATSEPSAGSYSFVW